MEEGGSGNSWIDAVEAERMIGSFLATWGHGNGACRDRGVPRCLRTSSFPLLSPLSPLPSSHLRCPLSSLEGFNVANFLSGPSPSPFEFGSTLRYSRLLCPPPSVALRVHLRVQRSLALPLL